jgi:uncharacterized membrane protein YhhN
MDRSGRKWLVTMYVASSLATCVLVELMPLTATHRLMKAVPLLLLCGSRWLGRGGSLTNWVGLGLFASLVGDIVIDSHFVAGLGSFLIAHIFYILAQGVPHRTSTGWLANVPAFFCGGTMYWILVGSGRAPEPLHIPVSIYLLVISTMFGRALARALVEKAKDEASRVFLLGAVFFVISDSLIGIRRWVSPFPHASVAIMATYYTAQWLIYCGSLRRR